MRNKEIGNFGEKIVAQYLKKKKWRILANNVMVPGGEIDLIAREARTGILVFVEVKTRSGEPQPGFKPEDLYRWKKLKVTKRSCQWYAAHFPKLILGSGWRIDLVTVQMKEFPLTNYKKHCLIKHYPNAV